MINVSRRLLQTKDCFVRAMRRLAMTRIQLFKVVHAFCLLSVVCCLWSFSAALAADNIINSNVGIGVTSTQAKLHVGGDIMSSGDLTVDGSVTITNSLQIPTSVAPLLSADGQIALETDSNSINIQVGDGTIIAANTDVALPLIQQKDITIVEPDQVQTVTDAIPVLAVDSYNYPNGITIVAIRLATSASSTLSLNVEEWSTPTDGSPVTIDAIATSGSTETTETTITDASVASGSYVFLDLDTTDVDWLKVTIWYYVND